MSTTTTLITRTTHLVRSVDTRVHEFAIRHSVTALRIALGFVFILFGFLKFFPGLSPAQDLATAVMDKLTFGLVPAQAALTAVAIAEVGVGLALWSNRFMRVAVWFLALEMVAILSPLVLLPSLLFSGPHHLPSLVGQYILKDFVLLAGVLVLFATQRGARIVPVAGMRPATARPTAAVAQPTTVANPTAPVPGSGVRAPRRTMHHRGAFTAHARRSG
jgi:uncharacterized membrane protein YphA (DoxX/SURF4 family)